MPEKRRPPFYGKYRGTVTDNADLLIKRVDGPCLVHPILEKASVSSSFHRKMPVCGSSSSMATLTARSGLAVFGISLLTYQSCQRRLCSLTRRYSRPIAALLPWMIHPALVVSRLNQVQVCQQKL